MDHESQSADLATTIKAEMSNELLSQTTAHKESPQPLHAFLLHAPARPIHTLQARTGPGEAVFTILDTMTQGHRLQNKQSCV